MKLALAEQFFKYRAPTNPLTARKPAIGFYAKGPINFVEPKWDDEQ
jgi:hypothetical protein